MVSIRKYLDARDARRVEKPEGGNSALAGLCSNILDHIGAYVLTGDSRSELKGRLDQGKSELSPEIAAEDALRVEDTVRGVLAGHAAREREAAQRVAVETQQMVGVLNDALLVLAGGGERSVSRLQRIQESLQRTSTMRDAEGLRASLADAVKLIREEAAKEQEHTARDLANFESQVIKVREHIAANPIRRLPGRGEAVQAIEDAARNVAPGNTLFAAAYSFDNIRAIIQRYGPEPVDELFFQVIRERTQPLAPVSTSWRWSPACVVSVFERASDLDRVQSELGDLCRAPLIYRMTLGNRTAVLKVTVSHLITAISPESLKTAIFSIDRFTGTEA